MFSAGKVISGTLLMGAGVIGAYIYMNPNINDYTPSNGNSPTDTPTGRAYAILLGKLFPEMSSYVRPVVKGAVRAGFSMSQKAREVLAEASEQVHDLVAEVKHEQEKEPPQSAQQARAASKIGAASGAVPVH